jgi:NAD-dependent deacetylase
MSDVLIERLRSAKSVVFFTGAGISAESGIATFRDKGGLWDQYKAEELANADAFKKDPQLVWGWYQARRAVVLGASPNPGHTAIAEMETLVPKVMVVTQNVDGLHRQAGSKNIVEVHGNIRVSRCFLCDKENDDPALLTVEQVPSCECGGYLRPGVVWFGEQLDYDDWKRAVAAATKCDVLFTVGTSSLVQPAASIPLGAHRAGAYVVEVNPEPTSISDRINEVIREASGVALPRIIEELRNS